MKNSKESGRRVVSYAEAARGRQTTSSAAGEIQVPKAPDTEAMPSPAPSRVAVEATVGKTSEQTMRPASSSGPAWGAIHGVDSEPFAEITKEQDMSRKAVTKDTQSKTQNPVPAPLPVPLPVSLEPSQTRRNFSYAQAARRGQNPFFNHPDSTTSLAHPPVSQGTENTNVSTSTAGASPSVSICASAPDKQSNKGKGKEKQQKSAGPQVAQDHSELIAPAAAVIDLGANPTGKKKKKSKKAKKQGNKTQPSNSVTPPAAGSSRPSTAEQEPTKPTLAQTTIFSVQGAAGPQVTSAAPATAQPGSAKRPKRPGKNKGTRPATTTRRTNAQQAVNRFTRPLPSRDVPPENLDAFVEARISEAIAREEARQWEFEQRELRTRAIIMAHDNNELAVPLWDSQYEWDVRILWRPQGTNHPASFNVHYDILCRESNYFRARLPPKNPDGGYINFDCSSHTRGQLANALKWMYTKTYDGGRIDFTTGAGTGRLVPEGDPICFNVYMYICGASVDCDSLMTFASNRIDEITEAIIDNNLFSVRFCRTNDLFRFYNPLAVALMMMYEQPHSQVMLMMRLAMARLCDAVLFRMLANEAFNRSVSREWIPRALWFNVINDNRYFGFYRVLYPMDGEDADDEQGSMVGTEVPAMPTMAQAPIQDNPTASHPGPSYYH